MNKKRQSVSVVIPVFNEESNMYDCLRALEKQVVKPHEIIVVDNNSTDQTVAIASRFKGVTIISESKQGLSFGRNTGFEYATGDILARIDADSIVAPDWVKRVEAEFADNEVMAITGFGRNRRGLVTNKTVNVLWNYSYFMFARSYFGVQVVWGANMAVRKSTYIKAKKYLFNDDYRNHEDQDLSMALAASGVTVKLVPTLVASVDFAGLEEIGKYVHYLQKQYYSKNAHKKSAHWNNIEQQQLPIMQRVVMYAFTAPTLPLFGLFCMAKSSVLFIRTNRLAARIQRYIG